MTLIFFDFIEKKKFQKITVEILIIDKFYQVCFSFKSSFPVKALYSSMFL